MAAVLLVDAVEPLYVFASGAPEALLVKGWRDAARTFFTETRAWRAEPEIIEVFVDEGDPDVVEDDVTYNNVYVLTPPFTSTEFFDYAARVKHSCQELDKLTYEQTKNRNYPVTGVPCAARIGAPNQLILMPTPSSDVSGDLSLLGILRPTRNAGEIDDSMEKYFDVIEFGALSYVLRAPNQPWTDFKLAASYGAMFEAEIDKHKHRGTDGDMTGVPRTVRYGGY